ncbi:hypothetical protein GCM10017744_030180 [Streptomyces antimycoticus]|uniref:Uncharacterized protein n=1 Tax=Streptomyces antimycoticus TaxID=68175 RepID=A0A4D4KDT6_9ACTN|nr:hypothetical protein [Streptomyces antimycoticus]GDY46324.1 hypothetical protein SANT12839_072060 [Streptomyces antimycoticus]
MARFLWLTSHDAQEDEAREGHAQEGQAQETPAPETPAPEAHAPESHAQDGGVPWAIRISDGPARRGHTSRPLAFPERRNPPGGGLPEYRAARKEGTRAFTLWADPHGGQVFAQVVTTSATRGGPAAYEVLGAAGEPLALVTRRPAMKGGLRTRWTVQQTGSRPAVGFKGRPIWWGVWWLFLPLQLLIVIGSILNGGGDPARTPRRTRWRLDRRIVLDFHSGPGAAFELTVVADWWDDRVAASLVGLLDSHGGWLGSQWDTAER